MNNTNADRAASGGGARRGAQSGQRRARTAGTGTPSRARQRRSTWSADDYDF